MHSQYACQESFHKIQNIKFRDGLQDQVNSVKDYKEAATYIANLNAEGPNPALKEKLMLFGQFVGDWDITECRFLKSDGTWGITKGELHWGWILGGTAVQDVWIGVAGESHGSTDMGTTVRFYDPVIDAWHSIWISPSQNTVKRFIGRKIGDEIVLSTKTDEGKLENWTFYDIGENEFKWKSEVSSDNGKTWVRNEEMLLKRK